MAGQKIHLAVDVMSTNVNDQMLPGTNHSRAIARSGVDWICVDCEHGNIDGAYHWLETHDHLTDLRKTERCTKPLSP